MALSKKEQSLLERLQQKAEEPEMPAVGRVINLNVDASKPEQIALAIKHGFLTSDDLEDEPEDEPEQVDDAPRRRGYFKDEK